MARTRKSAESVSDQSTQDQDVAVTPAENNLPKATTPAAKAKLIKASVEKGATVTVLRESSINGRTLTGVLHEVEAATGEGENATEAVYVLRTGQPGRPARLKASDIRTIVKADPPPAGPVQDADAS